MAKKTQEPEVAPKRYSTYKLLRTSITERQICEVIIEGSKVVEVIAHEPDVGSIVIGKFMAKLWQDEEKALAIKEAR